MRLGGRRRLRRRTGDAAERLGHVDAGEGLHHGRELRERARGVVRELVLTGGGDRVRVADHDDLARVAQRAGDLGRKLPCAHRKSGGEAIAP